MNDDAPPRSGLILWGFIGGMAFWWGFLLGALIF